MSWLGGPAAIFSIETFPRMSAGDIHERMRVMPHTSLKMIEPEDFDLLSCGRRQVEGRVTGDLPAATGTTVNKPIAAICGATAGPWVTWVCWMIFRIPAIPGFLKHYCPDYTGETSLSDHAL